jgi:tetratricopeptide (TPR) repeat protein
MRIRANLILICTLLAAFAPLGRAGSNPSALPLVQGGHYNRARAILEPRLQADPNDAEANWLLSQVYEASGRLKEALTLAQRAVDLGPNDARYHYQLADVYGEMAEHAGIFKQLGLAHHFKSEADTAVSLDPKFAEAWMALIEFYVEAPGIAGGGKDKARDAAQTIASFDPSEGYLAAARIAQSEKNLTAQEEGYKKAIAANPRNYEAYVLLANFYADKQKNYAEGERVARSGVALHPDRIEAYVPLVAALVGQNRWSDLDAVLAQAEKSVPDDFRPDYQAGRLILAQGGDLNRAEACFRRYLSEEPEAGAPGLAPAHWRLSQVLEKEGNRPQAKVELEAALRIQPDFPEAKQDLNRLR